MSAGPNANTYWGQATINGTWTSYLDCHKKLHYVPKLTITNHNPTLTARSRPVPFAPSAICQPDVVARTANDVMHPDSWYNPASWNWSKCISGAITGTMSNMSVTAAATAMTGGSSLVITPEGLVAVALGSCIAKIGW
jgi:hypothetical protein